MKRFGIGLALFGMSAVVMGCPKKEEAAPDAASSAQPTVSAAPDAAAAPLADNQADVTQYPDQVAASGSAPIVWSVANVRTQASSGAPLITVLKKGTDTTKVATKDNFVLITYKEPSPPNRTLMGWIDSKAYTPQIWDASVFITCPAGQMAILLEGGHEMCVTPCDSANDKCATGFVCDGDAPHSIKGQPGEDVEFCRVGNKKGQPTPTPTTTDAGTTPTTADAAPPAKPAAIAHKADAGACPGGYVQVNNDFCRLQCTNVNTPDICPAGNTCKTFGGGKMKACAGGS